MNPLKKNVKPPLPVINRTEEVLLTQSGPHLATSIPVSSEIMPAVRTARGTVELCIDIGMDKLGKH